VSRKFISNNKVFESNKNPEKKWFTVATCQLRNSSSTERRSSMTTTDACCSIAPYFKVHPDKLEAFQRLCAQLVEKTIQEPKCLFYAFTFKGDQAHCREGYADAGAVLAHLDNIGPLLQEALKMADLTRLEIHGPEAELEKLREPMAGLNPQFFGLEYGFRR
jgi:quinol monooxygenase YgiN